MTFLKANGKKLSISIAYFGYGLSGKSTNIQYIFNNTKAPDRIQLKLDFDKAHIIRCAIEIDVKPADKKAVLNLIAKTGNIYSPQTEFEILKNIDGVIFVAHCQKDLMHLNVWSFEELTEHLKIYGYEKITDLPFAVQCNKKHFVNELNASEIVSELNIKDVPVFEANARKGEGVFETLYCVINQIVKKKYEEE
jgi:hypothetical protein